MVMYKVNSSSHVINAWSFQEVLSSTWDPTSERGPFILVLIHHWSFSFTDKREPHGYIIRRKDIARLWWGNLTSDHHPLSFISTFDCPHACSRSYMKELRFVHPSESKRAFKGENGPSWQKILDPICCQSLSPRWHFMFLPFYWIIVWVLLLHHIYLHFNGVLWLNS